MCVVKAFLRGLICCQKVYKHCLCIDNIHFYKQNPSYSQGEIVKWHSYQRKVHMDILLTRVPLKSQSVIPCVCVTRSKGEAHSHMTNKESR